MARHFFVFSIILIYTMLSPVSGQPPAGYPMQGVKPTNPEVGTVQGKLTDAETLEPVSYASVRIVKEDGTLIAGELSKDDGTFAIKNIPLGDRYQLIASFLGYKEAKSELFSLSKESPVYIIKELKLGSDDQSLGEVEIVGEKSAVQIGIERKVYNVDKDLTSKGGSLQDVLKNVPSVDVNAENKVTLRGNEGVKILINGERSAMTENANFLQQLPANVVERIEVITSPSAKFDPEGTSGIINIVMKENKNRGASGTVNAGYGYGNDHKAEVGISLNYLAPKYSLNSGVSYRYNASEYNGYNTRYNLLSDSLYYIDQTDNGTRNNNSVTIRLGMDFTPNKKNTFGFSYLSNLSGVTSDGRINYEISDSTFLNTSYKVRSSFGDEPISYNGDVRSYYSRQLKKEGAKLRMGVVFSAANGEDRDNYQEYLTDEAFEQVADPYLIEETIEKTDSKEFEGSTDLTFPVSDKMIIEAGYKGSLNKRDNTLEGLYQDIPTETWINDTTRTNQFKLDEHIEAVYGTFQHTIGSFTYKAGLRMEYVWMNSRLINTNEEFQNNYFGIYPSLNLSYKLPKEQVVTLGFSRRVQRPGMWALNPFPNYSDPLNVRQGNPFLKPQFINSTEVGYTRYFTKGTFSSSLYYRYSTDVLNRIRVIDEESVSTVTWANVDKTHSWGIELLGDYKPYKWWNISANANLYQTKTVGSVEGIDLNNDNFSWNAGLTNTFNFWKSANVQLTFRYRAKFESAQFLIYPFTNLDLAFKKSFLKDNRATISLRGADLFNTLKFKLKSKEPNVEQELERHWESRVFWLTFTYNFGKMNTKRQGQGQQNSTPGGGGMEMMGP